MAQLPLLFVFLLLAGLDTLAVLVGIEQIGSASIPSLPAAAGIHLLVVVIAIAAVLLFPGAKERPGVKTLGVLAALLCLLTPVFGCLVSAWLIGAGPRVRNAAGPFAGIRFGNPCTGATRRSRPEPTPVSQPLVDALPHGHLPTQRMAAPLLRESHDPRSIRLLRHLREQKDARTQLYAQGALSAMFENREQALESLRRQAEQTPAEHPQALAVRERLASALVETAETGLRSSSESRALIEEAGRQFGRALEISPTDPACLFGKATCLLALGDLDGVPDLYGRLCAQTGAEFYADRLELAYFAALGNWQRITEASRRLDRDQRDGGMNTDQRRFWLGRAA